MRESRLTTTVPWWQPQSLAQGRTLHAMIGPLQLWLHHGAADWTLAWLRDDEDAHSLRTRLAYGNAELPTDNRQRHVLAVDTDTVTLQPALLDRQVVVRTLEPVALASGQSTTLYISTPICVRICIGEAAQLIAEVPALRLSDSWFGANTREGAVCYAARTHARNTLAEVPRRPHRAISPVVIRNRAPSALQLEKLSLPVPALALYGSDSGELWTESLNLEREADDDTAVLRVGSGTPTEAPGGTLLREARTPEVRRTVARSFSRLFG